MRLHGPRNATTRRSAGAAAHQHLEQFNRRTADEFTRGRLGLHKPYRKLVAIRSSQNLFMLEKALAETDPKRPTWW